MMKRNKRKSNYTICIYCEGSNTEPNYFERIKDQGVDYGFAVEILIADSDKSDPFGLVNEAISVLDEFNEVWVVFDKDGHPKLEEVFKDKKYNKIRKAFSSISFEQWILLHFEKSSNAFSKSCGIENRLRNQQYLSTYEKSNKYDLYPLISAYTEIAFENSAWLRREKLDDLRNEHNKIFKINPYTDVDILVSKLLNYNSKIFWFKYDDDIKFDKLTLKMKNIIVNNNHTIINFSIQNKKKIAHIINNNNIIYIRESSQIEERTDFIEIPTVLLDPGDISNISIKFPKLDTSKNYHLIIEQNSNMVIIELVI